MPRTAMRVRELREADAAEVARIESLHTGRSEPARWRGELRRPRVGLAAVAEDGSLAGYLVGEVRALEFGSAPCGWVLAVAVDPARARTGTATALLEEACRRFRESGAASVRTMVRRNDVPFLSFFRARGFVGGPFVQLERTLETPA